MRLNLGVFVRDSINWDGSFSVKPWQVVTLMHWDVEKGWGGVSEENPPGRWWFLVVRLTFIPRRIRNVTTLEKFEVHTVPSQWCYPTTLWVKKPGRPWGRGMTEWAPYSGPYFMSSAS